jgi:cyclopropane fatty-acyl-phospholipid synthase-like methyltransferase
MKSADYGEGYWEHGVGSNYVGYGDDPGWPLTALLMRQLLPDNGARLFEVGASKGWFLKAAVAFGIDAYGMDLSQWAVARRAPGVDDRLRLGNAAVDPIRGQREAWFDAVCSWEFLEHVPLDELDAVLRNMEDAIGWNGWLVHRIGIDVPGGEHGHQQDVTHQAEQPREWWEQLFAARGWLPEPAWEDKFRAAFEGRDWAERFFVWRCA